MDQWSLDMQIHVMQGRLWVVRPGSLLVSDEAAAASPLVLFREDTTVLMGI